MADMKQKIDIALKQYAAIALMMMGAIAFGQEQVSQIVVTNLSDSLNTQVIVDKSTGMDIRRLELDSKHVDKHKSKYTGISSLSIDVRKPKSVIMVKPLWAKGDSGKLMRVNDTLVNMHALRKLDTRNLIIDTASTKNVLVQDLSPYAVYLSSKSLAKIATQDLTVTSLDVSTADISNVNISSIGVSDVGVNSISIADLGVSPLNANSLAPYVIQVDGLGLTTLTISPAAVAGGTVSSLKIALLDPEVVNIKALNLDVAGINALQANLLAVQTLSPSVINVTDSSGTSSIMVIDGSQWNVDTSKFNVEVTEETYAELAEMKLVYNFEQPYNESIKSEVKLNDVRKLEWKQYLRWIKILTENKTSGIELIKNTEKRKIIGEAWILDGNYNAAVKANMLKNLKFLRARGYDTVLVRFRCTEDIDQLKQMITDIKDDGFEIFSTFTGLDYEHPAWNPFIDPETLEKYVSEIAPMCTGYLLNWRTTSNHVKIIPIEYFNYLCKLLRKANGKILIYGEVYYGNIDPLRMRTLVYTAPENVTGVMINNMGYYGYNITYVVNTLFATSVPGYRRMDKLGQVIGIAPYYCSRAATKISNLTVEKEYGYKTKVEKAFGRTNHGTVTMLHDGVDDNQTRLIAKPDDANYSDTTDNILYDTKIFDNLAAEEAQREKEKREAEEAQALAAEGSRIEQ